jgi:uncharacterized membrane protein
MGQKPPSPFFLLLFLCLSVIPALSTIVSRTLPLDDFKRFLYCKKYAIITLVNQRLLKCPQCLVRVPDYFVECVTNM